MQTYKILFIGTTFSKEKCCFSFRGVLTRGMPKQNLSKVKRKLICLRRMEVLAEQAAKPSERTIAVFVKRKKPQSSYEPCGLCFYSFLTMN